MGVGKDESRGRGREGDNGTCAKNKGWDSENATAKEQNGGAKRHGASGASSGCATNEEKD